MFITIGFLITWLFNGYYFAKGSTHYFSCNEFLRFYKLVGKKFVYVVNGFCDHGYWINWLIMSWGLPDNFLFAIARSKMAFITSGRRLLA